MVRISWKASDSEKNPAKRLEQSLFAEEMQTNSAACIILSLLSLKDSNYSSYSLSSQIGEIVSEFAYSGS